MGGTTIGTDGLVIHWTPGWHAVPLPLVCIHGWLCLVFGVGVLSHSKVLAKACLQASESLFSSLLVCKLWPLLIVFVNTLFCVKLQGLVGQASKRW